MFICLNDDTALNGRFIMVFIYKAGYLNCDFVVARIMQMTLFTPVDFVPARYDITYTVSLYRYTYCEFSKH